MAKILLSIFTGQSSPSSVAAYPNPNLVTVDDKLLVRGGVSSTHGDERVITLDEVALHDTPSDCWIIIYDRVYDITDFTDEHPGGRDILLEYAGRDASVAFRGSGHSPQAVRALARFVVGELPMHERIFRKAGGFRLSDIPD